MYMLIGWSCLTTSGAKVAVYTVFSHASRLGGSHLIWQHAATCVMLHLFILWIRPFDM